LEMKLSKILVLVAFTFVFSALGFAGPVPHMFDTNVVNDNAVGAVTFWPGQPTNGLQSFVYLTDGTVFGSGSGSAFAGPGSLSYLWTNFANNDGSTGAALGTNTANCDSNGTHASDDGQYCSDQPLAYNSAGNAQAGLQEIVIGDFFNVSGDFTSADPESAVLTSGLGAYFWTADNTGLPQSFGVSNFYELDVTVSATPGTGGGGSIPTPAGVWRLAFGVSATGIGATPGAVTLSNVAGSASGQDANGAYGLAASACTATDSACLETITFADSEFDPASGVPEPTTMLLVGSGLMFVAKRFKR